MQNNKNEYKFMCLCDYKTNKRTSMVNHLNKKNKCCEEVNDENTRNDILCVCKLCNKIYRDKEKHIKIHEKQEQKKREDEIIKKLRAEFDKKLKELSEKQTSQIITNNNTNTNSNNNSNNNITVNNSYVYHFKNYTECDISHITDEEMKTKCIELINYGNIAYLGSLALEMIYFHDGAEKQRCVFYINSKKVYVMKNNKLEKMSIFEFLDYVKQNKIKLIVKSFKRLLEDPESIIQFSKRRIDNDEISQMSEDLKNMSYTEIFPENDIDETLEIINSFSNDSIERCVKLKENGVGGFPRDMNTLINNTKIEQVE